MSADDLFDDVKVMPDPDVAKQFESLVGLDHLKATVLKEAKILVTPGLLERWSEEKHDSILPCLEQFHERSRLMVFHGDVGTGKTTLADSLGDPVARAEHIPVTRYRLSLATRGQGNVGQMTSLITKAFDEVAKFAKRGPDGAKPRSAAVFVIDEADALAESRETDQMHHEDRAGVNALIRGIDRLARERLPVLVILCTNRRDSIDPAVLRRTSISHEFGRPNEEQIRELLRRAFGGVFSDEQYDKLVRLTDPDKMQEARQRKPLATNKTYARDGPGRLAGYSFSDITQRLIPGIVREAFPDEPVSFDVAMSVLSKTEPTRPFDKDGGRK